MVQARFSVFSPLRSAFMPNVHSLRIDPSPQVPNNAPGGIGHHFLGFGIETASFPDYTSIHIFKTVTYLSLLAVLGNKSHPNNFSLNMFSNSSK